MTKLDILHMIENYKRGIEDVETKKILDKIHMVVYYYLEDKQDEAA